MFLPNWFILQSPPDLDLDIERWKQFAWDRVKLLEQLPQDRSRVIRDHFPLRDDDTLSKIYEDYRLGAYLLRLVAATNRRLEAWLIESEGDLFEYLYHDRTDSREEKLEIFKTIFGVENVMEYLEFKDKMDEDNNEVLAELYNQFHLGKRQTFLVCVHFSQVPWMVSKRRGYLRKGWVISNEVSFQGSLKKAFETLLQVEIDKARALLGVDEHIDQSVQEIEQKLAKHTQIRSRFSDVDFIGLDLHNHSEIFPPCMSYLSLEFEKSGRLIHTHRLQMGFFLKKIGMSVGDQLHYWFEKSVDNVGKSFNEFQRTSGYQIRHLYGLEGGRKDYEVPKCSTIGTSYFCPFIHLNPEILSEFLKNNNLTQKKSQFPSRGELARLISQSARNPTLACTEYFHIIFKKPLSWKIVHPMQWTRDASRIEGLLSDQVDSDSSSNTEEIE